MTVAKHLSQVAGSFSDDLKGFNGLSVIEKAEIQQWLYYCETQIAPSICDVQTMHLKAEVTFYQVF